MLTINIDNKDIEVNEGALLIDVMLENGISIPHFCYHKSLGTDGNCRMCMVEIEGQKRPQIACDTIVKEGMVIRTKGEKIEKIKRGILELELINHPTDCPICDQAGECKLQDYYMEVGLYDSRVDTPKVKAKKHIYLGSEVMLDQERCVLCKRCVRFTQIYTKTDDLIVEKRSDHSVITTFPKEKFDNPYAGNVVDLCPVGALTNRDFRFKKRVWFLSHGNGICMECSRGCNLRVGHDKAKYQDDTIYRFKPRRNDRVNGFFICDHGRYSYKKENDNRLFYSLFYGKKIEAKDYIDKLRVFLEREPLVIVSPSLSLEELTYIKSWTSKRGLRVVTSLKEYIDESFEDNLLKTKLIASNINAIKLLDIKVEKLQEILPKYKSIIIFSHKIAIEGFKLLKDKKVVNFTTTSTNSDKFKLSIAIASTYEKEGSYINCDWILQKSEKIVQKELQPPTILEILSILENQEINNDIIWQKYLNKNTIFKDINLSLLRADGYQLEIKSEHS